MKGEQQHYPCPCCGYRVFDLPPGFHQQCPICGWEDDLSQLRFPLMPGMANGVSLQEGQRNFARYGACQQRKRDGCRLAFDDEVRDPDWRPLDEARDNPEQPRRGINYGETYPYDDTTVLYYWRLTYWRRLQS